MKWFIRLVALLAAIQLRADDQLDVKGWDEVRWGMSRDEVAKIYPRGHQTNNAERSNFSWIIDGHRIAEKPMTVKMDFKNQDALCSVILIAREWEPSPREAKGLFELYVAKYGPPATTDVSTGSTGGYITAKWLKPSGEIEFSYISDSATPWMCIFYRPRTTAGI